MLKLFRHRSDRNLGKLNNVMHAVNRKARNLRMPEYNKLHHRLRAIPETESFAYERSLKRHRLS